METIHSLVMYTIPFNQLTIQDVPTVGGKNASLGELFQALTPRGIRVPDGFAVTAAAYWEFLRYNNLEAPLKSALDQLDTDAFSNLTKVGGEVRALIAGATLPEPLQASIKAAYHELMERVGPEGSVAVRSSATAEDLPEASFAGQQESFLNIKGADALLRACLACYESLFTDRAIKYRIDNGFEHMDVALSIGIQYMVRSDLAAAGVGFTLEPESGFRDVIVLNGSWGLGEYVVKGRVEPDEFIIYKQGLQQGRRCILKRKRGAKEEMLVYSESPEASAPTESRVTPPEKKAAFVLTDAEAEQLARWALLIEAHFQLPMDIEWAKDGHTGELFIVQARPETVHARADRMAFKVYQLTEKGQVLASGSGLGNKITAGHARILHAPAEAHRLQEGEVLVTDITDPDWDPILKRASAIVTNRGGRTSHAAIVAREQGAVAVVGTGDATSRIADGQLVTVSAAEGTTGKVYAGRLQWSETEVDLRELELPRTQVMLILGDPDKAFHYAALPSQGVGLMRLEFIIANAIQVHPMALVQFERVTDPIVRDEIEQLTRGYSSKADYFVDKLAQAVGTIAAAFYPREVIVRMSDFKSNEYANLIGGSFFEPREENPMLGFRGASRYAHERYREGFRLECAAMKVVRDEMGLTNVKLMIPFCRTLEEGQRVLELMAEYQLHRGDNGLEIYTMIEVPSNVILAEGFARLFDGFSIGSNDLTQLTLGLDRDNDLISDLFNEQNEAVTTLIAQVIQSAKRTGTKIGLCGQAPSDYPEFARFLVEQGIDSVSFNADALLKGIEQMARAEGHQHPVTLS